MVIDPDAFCDEENLMKLPKQYRQHPMWIAMKRFCATWCLSKQKGSWRYLDVSFHSIFDEFSSKFHLYNIVSTDIECRQNVSLEWERSQGDSHVPDVGFTIHGSKQTKRQEGVGIVKFLIQNLLMSSLSPQVDSQLNKILNAAPLDAEMQKVTIVTSGQVIFFFAFLNVLF